MYINFDQDVEGELVMLVLTRKLGESITIDDNIKIRVEKIRGKQVRLGIEAPKETRIYREEVYNAIKEQNEESSQTNPDSTRAAANLLKTPKNA
jgi:carbon storage regulator